MRWLAASMLWILPALAVLAAEPATATTAPLSAEPVTVGSYVQMILGLLFVIALIVGLAWMVRRMGHFQTSAAGSLKLLAGLSLGQRERVVLVQVGDTQLLLGVAPGRVAALHVLETPIETGPAPGGGGGFAQRLQDAIRQGVRQ